MTVSKDAIITRAISKRESEVTWLIGVEVFVGVGVTVGLGVGDGEFSAAVV